MTSIKHVWIELINLSLKRIQELERRNLSIYLEKYRITDLKKRLKRNECGDTRVILPKKNSRMTYYLYVIKDLLKRRAINLGLSLGTWRTFFTKIYQKVSLKIFLLSLTMNKPAKHAHLYTMCCHFTYSYIRTLK